MGIGGTVGVGDGSAVVALAVGRVRVGAIETVAVGMAVAERDPVLVGVDNAVGFDVVPGSPSVAGGDSTSAPVGVRAGSQPNRRKMSKIGQKRLVRQRMLITDTSICKRQYCRPLTIVDKRPGRTA